MNPPKDGVIHHTTKVGPDWLDINEHMNVAYYSVAFDQAAEALISHAGITPASIKATQNSWVVLEVHLTYQNEARLNDELLIKARVHACDHKRVHVILEMYCGERLLATPRSSSHPFQLRHAANLVPLSLRSQQTSKHYKTHKHICQRPPGSAGRSVLVIAAQLRNKSNRQ